jgi:pyridoxine 4-dehydrogenase
VSVNSRIRLGDREVARVGLGTNRLTSTSDYVTFVREAVVAGLGLIDTAHLYTAGQSEQTIGEALASGTEDCIVATKGGYSPGEGRPDVLRVQIDRSLRSLRTDTIDLYYLHRVDPETPLEESLGAIKEYVDSGEIRHVGLSQVSIEQIDRARTVVPITAVQNQYNLSDRRFDDVVDHCAREDIVFVPFFPLRGGGDRALAEVAERHEATLEQIALAWLLKRSPVMLPIPGTLSLEHLKDNLAALDIELGDDEFDALA